jgi:hypothetical protein
MHASGGKPGYELVPQRVEIEYAPGIIHLGDSSGLQVIPDHVGG